MKKHFPLIIIFIIAFLQTKSQNNVFEYGLQAGVNFSSASGSSVNKDYRGLLAGVTAGGYFKINTSKQFGIKTIVKYDQNGWAYRSLTFEDNVGNSIGKGDVLFKLNYLNIPVLAEYSFGNKIRFNAGGGLFFGVLLNNQIITKRNDPLAPDRVITIKSHSDDLRSANFGISLSGGIQIPLSSKVRLDFCLNENYGLTDINKSNGEPHSTLKTNSFSIISGLSFLW